MRNLYIRLGIAPSASEQEIKAAIARCTNSAVKSDGLEVLLDPSRRRNYDRVHRTLCDIGTLRAHLGLSHGDNWDCPQSEDYSAEPTHSISLHDELVAKIKLRNRKSKIDGFLSSIRNFIAGFFRLVKVFGVLAGIIWGISVWDENRNSSITPQKGYTPAQQPKFNELALQLPSSGTIRRYTSTSAIAPLEIQTSIGSNYLVKLEDIASGNNILDVFVQGGSTVKVEVPLGTYRLKYAAGQTWYGYEYYFGPKTTYKKADSKFKFYKSVDGLTGYTVMLYQVRDGNLSTSGLAPEQF